MMNWSAEEDLKGISENFFDDIINNIDFPLEDIDSTNVEDDWEAKFRDLEPPPMEMFTSLPSEFVSAVVVQKTVPTVKQSKLFQSLSPVSVLENSDGSFSPLNSRTLRLSFPVKGLRSKRKRPTAQRLGFLLPFEAVKREIEYGSYDSSEQLGKKKRKSYSSAHSVGSVLEVIDSDGVVRKCTHCETTKTPQWREGPSGPKTLCNACGVRYRSGRLVPEYRPASSPTFIPSVHSNSHRKIIEMRRKDGDQFETSMIHAVTSGGA